MSAPEMTRHWPEIVRRAHASGNVRQLAFIALMEEYPLASATDYALTMGCSRRYVEMIARDLGVSLKKSLRPVIMRTVLLSKAERDAVFGASVSLLSGVPCSPELAKQIGTALSALYERSALVPG